MRATIAGFMAASAAALLASAPQFVAYPYQREALRMLAATPTRYRNRQPGNHRPAGTKLARKALKGRIGLATIR